MPASTRKTTTRQAEKPAKEEKPKNSYGEREDGSLSGNLTRDFELRFTPSGRAVASSSVAVNERVQNEDGKWEDTKPEFFNVTVWGEQAEHVVDCLTKGVRVVAVGFFQDRTWENKDGEEVTTTEFTARDIGPSLLFREATLKPRAKRS